MRENKEKTVTSGDEDAAAPPLVQVASVQARKRKSKTISSAVDLDDLPSRRGPKKQKSSKTSLPKVPKFTPPTVNMDEKELNILFIKIKIKIKIKNLFTRTRERPTLKRSWTPEHSNSFTNML